MDRDHIQIGEVRLTVDEAQETLWALRAGKVDAVLVEGEAGHEIYTFRDPGHPYRLLVEAMSEGAALVTPDGTLCYLNPHLADLVGAAGVPMYGRCLADLIAPGQRSQLAALLERVRGGHPARNDFELMGKEGRVIPVKVSVSPARLIDVDIFCVVITDLTEHHRQEALYREARREVEARDRLFSVASHELRTPLSVLQLQAHLLIQLISAAMSGAPWPAERALALVQKIREHGTRLSELIGRLLDVGSIGAGRLSLTQDRVDLAEAVQAVVERSQDLLSHSSSPVTLEVESVVGLWDQVRIEQVIENLISNAAKYGLGRPIRVVVERQGDIARLRVEDQGRGIPEEARERIFRPYERIIDAEAQRIPGLGLGLYVSAEIVKAHGGTIRVEKRPGGGSVFIVELPTG
jgi:PAS domain S-box-containing protein